MSWRRWLAIWGASLAAHLVLLLLLGLMMYAHAHRSGPDRAGIRAEFSRRLQDDDLTTLIPGERGGDPFTRTRSEDAPSLALEPDPDGPINLPELSPRVTIAAEVRPGSLMDMATSGLGIDRGLGGVGSGGLAPVGRGSGRARGKASARARASTISGLGAGGSGTGLAREVAVNAGPTAPFQGRRGDMKAQLLRREGGTVESEKAVERGLEWLARHQRGDGSWGLDTSPQCRGQGCPPRRAAVSDTAATGLALLPFLAAGHSHVQKGRYQRTVLRGLRWLVKNQQANGEMFNGGLKNSGMYSHAIASMALCEAYGLTGEPTLKAPAQRALDYIAMAQNPDDGGWRYVPGMAGDTSVFGWQIFALRSGAMAGLRVTKDTIRNSSRYLDFAAADPNGVSYSYMPGQEVSPVMTAEALLGRQYLGWTHDNPALIKGTALIVEHLRDSQERNIYYWYYATQLLHNMKGKDWETWNPYVRDGLIATQVISKGCDQGSWDPVVPATDRWGRLAGRLYMTSLSLLTLEVYYRYLPLYRDREGGFAGPGLVDPEGPSAPHTTFDQAKDDGVKVKELVTDDGSR